MPHGGNLTPAKCLSNGLGGWMIGLGMDIAIIEKVVKFRASTWLYCL